MSLAGLRKIDRDGVDFRSHIDGSRHRLTPAISVELQFMFDATISMVLDECIAFPTQHETAEASMELSMRWACLSKQAYRERQGYGLFGDCSRQHFRRSAAAVCRLAQGYRL